MYSVCSFKYSIVTQSKKSKSSFLQGRYILIHCVFEISSSIKSSIFYPSFTFSWHYYIISASKKQSKIAFPVKQIAADLSGKKKRAFENMYK